MLKVELVFRPGKPHAHETYVTFSITRIITKVLFDAKQYSLVTFQNFNFATLENNDSIARFERTDGLNLNR